MIGTACDLAISAVTSDVGLVAELQTHLTPDLTIADPRLDVMSAGEDVVSPLDVEYSRLAVILYQRLWLHDPATRRDEIVLRERIRSHPKSICVLMLDDTPAPRWLSTATFYDLATHGRSGMIDFILDAASTARGSKRVRRRPVEVETPARLPSPPVPFLSQPRAHSALRRELDAITGELEGEIERSRARSPERLFELHVLPNRVIARMDDIALTVSWIGGRQATVADGRLMVIAWGDVSAEIRGIGALKSAAPTRERTYLATGNTADEWCWRADDVTDLPYSSANLAADWIAQAAVARAG
jgi:hypothetical protein